ncbi:YbgA family protein [Staphylococcus carnosus]|uniref:YbgA family protein n=1 Tax=Staphylococcus carnosus TaxID=1281 RepID=UPI0005A2B325|nr:YbgA family protein [Staphylococcus carnosus]UQA68527.1 YbgA family protein [Staphylococcus carnosus]UTB77916.1 hypothetical protein A2I62_04765 [Staphylococcus carnosus]UTB87461.1 hypothetical protein A2I63_04755 [Staphylococcus carnosus]UTB89812.1 hypothetical protein A2I64_04760 [Staphylococcus carnosus]
MNKQFQKEKLWSRYKYEVLWHDQNAYNDIRFLMNNDVEIEIIQQKIQYALNKQPSKGSIINAYCHMWGYFKKISTEQEKQLFKKLKTDFENHIITEKVLIDFIKKLADLYEVTYLKQSTIINKAHLNE